MVMGATEPMRSMRRCASASLELRCRLPANLLVAAFGCSHSMCPEQRSKALSCASTVAEGASLDMTEVSTEGDCFPCHSEWSRGEWSRGEWSRGEWSRGEWSHSEWSRGEWSRGTHASGEYIYVCVRGAAWP